MCIYVKHVLFCSRHLLHIYIYYILCVHHNMSISELVLVLICCFHILKLYFQAFLLLLMLTEAGIVLGRRKSHFRVSRCLRPFFLLDIEVLHDVRRCI